MFMLSFYENTKFTVSNKNNMIVITFLISDFGKVILVEKSFLQTHKFDEDCKSDGST
jgi:hypothetical protein